MQLVALVVRVAQAQQAETQEAQVIQVLRQLYFVYPLLVVLAAMEGQAALLEVLVMLVVLLLITRYHQEGLVVLVGQVEVLVGQGVNEIFVFLVVRLRTALVAVVVEVLQLVRGLAQLQTPFVLTKGLYQAQAV